MLVLPSSCGKYCEPRRPSATNYQANFYEEGGGEEIELSLWTEMGQFKGERILRASVRRLPAAAAASAPAAAQDLPFRVIQFRLESAPRLSTHFYNHHQSQNIEIEEAEEAVARSCTEVEPSSEINRRRRGEEFSAKEKAPIKSCVMAIEAADPAVEAAAAKATKHAPKSNGKRLAPFRDTRAALRLERSLRRWINLSLLSQRRLLVQPNSLQIMSTAAAAAGRGLLSVVDNTSTSQATTTKTATTTARPSQAARKERLNFTAMISYSRSEAQPYALSLKSQLEELGVSCYLDLDEILLGSDWEDSLNEAVRNCEAFVCLVTPSYGSSLWTARELKLADLLGKHIIPVNFGQLWPPPPLAIQFATMQYIRWSDRAANAGFWHPGSVSASKALESLAQNPAQKSPIWRSECVASVANQIKLSIERMRSRRRQQQQQQMLLAAASVIETTHNNEEPPLSSLNPPNRNSLQMRRRRLQAQADISGSSREEREYLITSGGGWLAGSAKTSNDQQHHQNRWARKSGGRWLQLKLPAANHPSISPESSPSEDSAFNSAGSSSNLSSSLISDGGSFVDFCRGFQSIGEESDGSEPTASETTTPKTMIKTTKKRATGGGWCEKPCKLRFPGNGSRQHWIRWSQATKALKRLRRNLTWSRAEAAAIDSNTRSPEPLTGC